MNIFSRSKNMNPISSSLDEVAKDKHMLKIINIQHKCSEVYESILNTTKNKNTLLYSYQKENQIVVS